MLVKHQKNFLKKIQEKTMQAAERALDMEIQVMETGLLTDTPIPPLQEGEKFDMFKAPYQMATIKQRTEIAAKIQKRVLPPPAQDIHIKGFMAHGFMEWSPEEKSQALLNRLNKIRDEREIDTTATVVDNESDDK